MVELGWQDLVIKGVNSLVLSDTKLSTFSGPNRTAHFGKKMCWFHLDHTNCVYFVLYFIQPKGFFIMYFFASLLFYLIFTKKKIIVNYKYKLLFLEQRKIYIYIIDNIKPTSSNLYFWMKSASSTSSELIRNTWKLVCST